MQVMQVMQARLEIIWLLCKIAALVILTIRASNALAAWQLRQQRDTTNGDHLSHVLMSLYNRGGPNIGAKLIELIDAARAALDKRGKT